MSCEDRALAIGLRNQIAANHPAAQVCQRPRCRHVSHEVAAGIACDGIDRAGAVRPDILIPDD